MIMNALIPAYLRLERSDLHLQHQRERDERRSGNDELAYASG